MEGGNAKCSRRLSPPHPPLVEVKVVDAPHAWPNWQSFSPPEHAALSSTYKSTEDTDNTIQPSPSETGQPLQSGSGGAMLYGEKQQALRRKGPQMSTVALLALVMCLGVCLVGVFGFLPMYLIGFRDVSAAVGVAQSQAVASMVASASMSMRRLPNIIKFILATYMSSIENTTLCGDPWKMGALFYLSNVLSKERYKDFLTLITGVYAVEGEEFFVIATSFFKRVPLAGTVARANETGSLYAVNTSTHELTDPPVTIWNTEEKAIVYIRNREENLDKRCLSANATLDTLFVEARGGDVAGSSVPVEMWMPWNISGSISYFSLIIPLHIASAGKLCNAFVEAGLRSSYVANVVQEHFRYAVRQHGCYMIVDLARDIVVLNSWNQLVSNNSVTEPAYRPFSMSAVEHPLMRAAVADLERRRGVVAVAKELNESEEGEFVFHFHGKKATLRVSPIRNLHGLDLMFFSVTIQRDFFASIDRTMHALTYTLFAAVITTAVVSYAVAVYLRSAIQQLTTALRSSSRLRFPTATGGGGGAPHSRIAELKAVETAYAHVQEQLMTLKTVLPCTLLIDDDEASGNSDDGDNGNTSIDCRGSTNSWSGSSTRSSTRSGTRSSSTIERRRPRRTAEADAIDDDDDDGDMAVDARGANEDSSPTEEEVDDTGNETHIGELGFTNAEQSRLFSARVSKRCMRNLVLNTKVFNEKVNVFRKRYCTLVWITRHYAVAMDDASLDTFFKVVYDTAAEFKGCLQVMRPDYVVVTFNAHISLPMHAKHGCDMALAVQRRMPASAVKLHTTLVDTNNFFVGTCGSENGLKSLGVFDVMHLMGIDMVLREKGYHQVVVTQSTAKHLEYYETVPLEVVSVPFHEALYTLYELRDPRGGNVAEMQQTAEWFRSGFQRMRIGDYVSALKSLTRIAASDTTAQRLKLVCMKNIREGNKDNYMYRVRYPKLRILSRVVHLRNTSNLHLFAVRMWMKTQVDGFFIPGAFSKRVTATSSVETLDQSDSEGNAAMAATAATSSLTGQADAREPALLPDSKTTRQRLADGAEEAESSGSGSERRDGALIEWIDFPSASETEDTEDLAARAAASPTSAADAIPLCLLDSNGERWNRALKADHSGPASLVYQAMADDGLQVAIKFLPKKSRSIPETRLYNEISVMSNLKHLNIVQYISYVWTETHVGIVMEYAPGGSLRDTIDGFGALPESLVRRYMVDILHGLAYLHRGNITHGDVKPHNILLGADGVCKLSDFGSTVCEATDLARSNGMLEFRGTAVYTSPEVASGQLPTAASDIYSLGISFLQMLMGRLPWRWTDPHSQAKHGDCMTVREVAFVQAVGRGEIRPVISTELSTAAQEFAQACCRTLPAERPTVSDLLSFRFVL